MVTFAILLFRQFQRVVSLESRDLGNGPLFMVVDPGVHYQGPLPSPILTVQALCTQISVLFLQYPTFESLFFHIFMDKTNV